MGAMPTCGRALRVCQLRNSRPIRNVRTKVGVPKRLRAE